MSRLRCKANSQAYSFSGATWGRVLFCAPRQKNTVPGPTPPKPATPVQATQFAVENSGTTEPAKPTLRIETTTVDTGERKEMFGYEARHVITTRKQTALDGSNSQPSQSVTDGWYIDIDRSISCDPKPSLGSKRIGILFSSVGVGNKQMPIDRPEFVEIGARETGLPVKEAQTFPMTTKFSDGTRATSAHSAESEVTVLEKAPLDPALFEVPPGYKQVEPSQRKAAE
jgi:hypothetical protein